MTEYKLKEAVQQSPLTGLPGNESIHDCLMFKLAQKQPFSVIYSDVDHFKSYNDVYGFKYGDDVLKWAGRVLSSFHYPDQFIGHIGGDDFVTCMAPDHAEQYCKKVIEQFEIEKKQFYSAEDHSNNYIQSLDRDHKLKRFPLICLSMVIVDIAPDKITELSEISLLSAKFKKQAKQIQGSNYIRVTENHSFTQ
jgi:diguanylate cyclase (GGDEF)-like protein